MKDISKVSGLSDPKTFSGLTNREDTFQRKFVKSSSQAEFQDGKDISLMSKGKIEGTLPRIQKDPLLLTSVHKNYGAAVKVGGNTNFSMNLSTQKSRGVS